jgi:hypothetical protein
MTIPRRTRSSRYYDTIIAEAQKAERSNAMKGETHHTPDGPAAWKEMKARFLREFTPDEQVFFLKRARECVKEKGYPVSEDLFNYCWFQTLAERLRRIDPQGCEGVMRFLLVESRRDLQAEVLYYEQRIEEKKRPGTDRQVSGMVEYLES